MSGKKRIKLSLTLEGDLLSSKNDLEILLMDKLLKTCFGQLNIESEDSNPAPVENTFISKEADSEDIIEVIPSTLTSTLNDVHKKIESHSKSQPCTISSTTIPLPSESPKTECSLDMSQHTVPTESLSQLQVVESPKRLNDIPPHANEYCYSANEIEAVDLETSSDVNSSLDSTYGSFSHPSLSFIPFPQNEELSSDQKDQMQQNLQHQRYIKQRRHQWKCNCSTDISTIYYIRHPVDWTPSKRRDVEQSKAIVRVSPDIMKRTVANSPHKLAYWLMSFLYSEEEIVNSSYRGNKHHRSLSPNRKHALEHAVIESPLAKGRTTDQILTAVAHGASVLLSVRKQTKKKSLRNVQPQPSQFPSYPYP